MSQSNTPPPDEPWTGEFGPPSEVQRGPEVGFSVPDVRRPIGGVAINGVRIDKLLIDFEVRNNRFTAADTFRVSLALDEASASRASAGWFGRADRMEVEVFASLHQDQPAATSLLLGRADSVDIDLDRRQITLSGRDMTADLLETQTTEKWPNRTSSEIARDLAGRHGLTPVVTDTTRRAGHYYRQEHATLTDATTEWNLLTYLAEQEGFDVFIRGRELHFGPPPDPATAPRWVLQYNKAGSDKPYAQAKAGRIRLHRDLTLAKDISVKVVSWNARQKRSFTITRRRQQAGGRSSSGQFTATTPHVFRLPGLTEEQAIREAERRLEDLTKISRSIEVDGLPGLPQMDIRTVLVVRGTATSWDVDYQIEEMTRRMSRQGGFEMSFRARILAAMPDNTAVL